MEPPSRADIADQRFTRVQADPVQKHAALESLDHLVQLLETRPAHERCADGIAGVIGVIDRRAEHRPDRITAIFFDVPTMLFDNVGHRRQIFVQERDQRVWRHRLGNRGKA